MSETEQSERQKIADFGMETMREMLAAGYRDFRWLETAPELTVLRERPEFQALMQEFKK